MFIAHGLNRLFKLRRSGMYVSPLTGLGFEFNSVTINMPPLAGLNA